MVEHKSSSITQGGSVTAEQQNSFYRHVAEAIPVPTAPHLPDNSVEHQNLPPVEENTPAIVATNYSDSNSSMSSEELDQARIVGAGVASGTIGMLLGGPLFAMLLGFGAAYAAGKHDGSAAGDVARAIGDVALSTKEKAIEMDRKHHIVERVKESAAKGWQRAQEVDREHHVLDQAKNAIVFSWNVTVDFIQKHNLIERGVEVIGKFVCWTVEKIMNAGNQNTTTTTSRAATNP